MLKIVVPPLLKTSSSLEGLQIDAYAQILVDLLIFYLNSNSLGSYLTL